MTCTHYPLNPQLGLLSFDNIGWSLLTVFNCVSLESWSTAMYLVRTAWCSS
jgi:voltage-dependent calcium channel L type alpha-1D